MTKETFDEDLNSPEFKAGIRLKRWGVCSELLPEHMIWPKFCFWVKVASRPDSPEKLYILVDLTDYPHKPPSGTFWDITQEKVLDETKYPKMKSGSSCERIFTTRWRTTEGVGFYCHFDSQAIGVHPEWLREHTDQSWTHQHTIANYLDFFQKLLSGPDYEGTK